MNRKEFLENYSALSVREQNLLKEQLAQPWIANNAIESVPADINVILDLQFKAQKLERKAGLRGLNITSPKKNR